ncbi:hypothetical protein [Antarctobacter heliothermus]|uniref:Lipoprotein n=1 Tax=Antarctobacter heliothermus TaxID=74033 RepID=A0A239AP33_9RHOB|nr:hypothetical protein [Antarctobacter heliothermus]SNR97101.1 hypothetical protein SAMN04488078_100128 [Antarctobacter heliothermus]
MRRPLILALCTLLMPVAASAARIGLTDDPAYGCLVELSGRIEPGDATRLRAAIEEAASLPRYDGTIYVNADLDDGRPNFGIYQPLHLCLDSPGGSLSEAMDLIDVVHGHLGTVVRDGARCESACALVFMAGSHSTETDFGLSVNRFLHVGGKLGFHAPSLTVAEGRYDADTVERAYRVSVSVTELIFRNLVRFRFSPSLAARMHATPAEDMFYVTTVEQAARWGIAVLGVDSPSSVTDAVIRTACGNLYLSALDRMTSDPEVWPNALSGMNEPVERLGDQGYSYRAFGQEAAGACVVRAENPNNNDGIAGSFWGTAPLVRTSVWATANVRDAEPPVSFGFLQNFMAWPGVLPLDALPRDGQARVLNTSGTCTVFDSADRLTDSDPCTRARQATGDGGMTDTHFWPSGARTLLEYQGGTIRVNGNSGGISYWPGQPVQGAPRPTCTLNSGSGNRFCFQALD